MDTLKCLQYLVHLPRSGERMGQGGLRPQDHISEWARCSAYYTQLFYNLIRCSIICKFKYFYCTKVYTSSSISLLVKCKLRGPETDQPRGSQKFSPTLYLPILNLVQCRHQLLEYFSALTLLLVTIYYNFSIRIIYEYFQKIYKLLNFLVPIKVPPGENLHLAPSH
jgi:hypothetical protein